ncbi:MAG: dihydropteroate synthase [Gammaproteobacteria bacterium]|nr:dihydropteroate synthase [Gammaproteobacteria bacterium]
MGVLNVTPDSFWDGGRYRQLDDAVAHGLRMVAEGADIVDIGGESTRPGASSPGTGEELERVIPVIRKLRQLSDVPISVDTSSAEVMRAAIAAGADMINDVSALTRPGALEAAAAARVPVCLMHMQGEPQTMQQQPSYVDVLAEVRDFLLERASACMAAGLPRDCLILDPGFGFGKNLQHNLGLLRGLDVLVAEGFPVLVGLSRKSMLGELLGRAAEDRLPGSLALAVAARQRGARIVRVHDVAATLDVFRTLDAVEGAG